MKGRAKQIRDPDELATVGRLSLRPWTLGDKVHWIRIVPAEITGRRIWLRSPGKR